MRIIVSFTTIPSRVQTLNCVLDSILAQTKLPDSIYLYVSRSQFNKEQSQLLIDITEPYISCGLHLVWVDGDIGPHKKYYYAMQQFPDDVIITIDDDVIYPPEMISRLWNLYMNHPTSVISNRTYLMSKADDNTLGLYKHWLLLNTDYYTEERMDLFATGCAGVLYPPHLFSDILFEKKSFMKLCPFADDVWLKANEVYCGIPVVISPEQGLRFIGYDGLYVQHNKAGGNDEQIRRVFSFFESKDALFRRKLSIPSMIPVQEVSVLKKEICLNLLERFWQKIGVLPSLSLYGAGKIAYSICAYFAYNGSSEMIDSILVESTENNPSSVLNIPVVSYLGISEAPQNILITVMDRSNEQTIIARLHEVLGHEISILTLDFGTKNSFLDYVEYI